jgi:hypothetical protein
MRSRTTGRAPGVAKRSLLLLLVVTTTACGGASFSPAPASDHQTPSGDAAAIADQGAGLDVATNADLKRVDDTGSSEDTGLPTGADADPPNDADSGLTPDLLQPVQDAASPPALPDQGQAGPTPLRWARRAR